MTVEGFPVLGDSEDLTALRDIECADVYKQGGLAATLTRTADGVRFDYQPTWIHDGRPPIATTLPVGTAGSLRAGGALPAFFAGLLPEGRRLTALARQVKSSADDELTLLLAVGADVVGDVQVVPAGVVPTDLPPRIELRADAPLDYDDLIRQLGMNPDRVGLPGVQDKVSAGVVNLPVTTKGARYILKLNPPDFPQVVENEAFFLSAARSSGLNIPNAQIVTDRVGRPGLLVQRFDRPVRGRVLPPASLAVEDACQVLGMPPADKYRVSTESVFTALAGVCQAPLPALRVLFTQLVFAFLSGNGDAHAKNFAVLQDAHGEWRPSPAFDLPSTYPYGDTTMALSLAGSRRSDIGGADFLALAFGLGLPQRAASRILAEQSERVELWLPRVKELPFDDRRMAARLTRFITHRRGRLAQR